MKRTIKIDVGETPTIVTKQNISGLLFHEGRMLLVDNITISSTMAVAEFVVPVENCDGHEPKPGFPVMRGVEMPEMGFQLLAVLCAQNEELATMAKGKIFVAREITGVRFNGMVRPRDKLILETCVDVSVDEVAGILRIESGKMMAKKNAL